MTKGTLYLIPNLLSETTVDLVIPQEVKELTVGLRHFIVENEKVTRRYLRQVDRTFDIDGSTFYPMGKHADAQAWSAGISALLSGQDVGLISDAGCPGVADPGAAVVASAQRNGIEVKPLVGPSSILLTLMASGMNGQEFAFHGYLPRERADRSKKIKSMVQQVTQYQATQLFMDTPFRNENVLDDVLSGAPGHLMLCIARDVTGAQEFIRTMSIADWQKTKRPSVAKIPTMFALGH